jgi:hypothetical protein
VGAPIIVRGVVGDRAHRRFGLWEACPSSLGHGEGDPSSSAGYDRPPIVIGSGDDRPITDAAREQGDFFVFFLFVAVYFYA